MTEKNLEKQLIELIATDRIGIPIKSMAGKIDKRKKNIAGEIELPKDKASYTGERVYARIEHKDLQKARAITDAVQEYCEEYPKQGEILTQIIEDKRAASETHLYFGMNSGCKLSSKDYMDVMIGLGFSETKAEAMYQELMDASRRISRARQEDRKILIGSIFK